MEPSNRTYTTQITWRGIFAVGVALSVVALVSIALFGYVDFVVRRGYSNSEPQGYLKRMSEGAIAYTADHCEFPPGFRSHDVEAIPGGDKVVPIGPQPDYDMHFADPTYFVYSAAPFLDGEAMRLEARADVKPGGPHTVHYVFLRKSGECEAEVAERHMSNAVD